MSEPMQVWVEVHAVAADDEGIWLLSGKDGALQATSSVSADNHPHQYARDTLRNNGFVHEDIVDLHAMSWHVEGPQFVTTYLAVVRRPGYVVEHWPSAIPITPRAVDLLGPAAPHSPVEPPTNIREFDCLMLSLKHLKHLLENNANTAAALDDNWRRHLAPLKSAMAQMYQTRYDEVFAS